MQPQQTQEGELRKMLLLSPELFEKICKNEPSSITQKREALSRELIPLHQKSENKIKKLKKVRIKKRGKSTKKVRNKPDTYQKWVRVQTLLTDYLKALKNNRETSNIPIVMEKANIKQEAINAPTVEGTRKKPTAYKNILMKVDQSKQQQQRKRRKRPLETSHFEDEEEQEENDDDVESSKDDSDYEGGEETDYTITERLGAKKRRLDTTAIFPKESSLRPKSRLNKPNWLKYARE